MNRGFLRSWITYKLMYPIKKRRMFRLFSNLGLSDYSLVFDIGAHLGDKTRFFADQGIAVVALEPQIDYYSKLQEYFRQNSQVTVIRKAVSDIEGVMELQTSSKHPTVSTISKNFIKKVQDQDGWKLVKWDGTEQVDVTTLNILIEKYGFPNFVKIDVEGHEHRVIQGLSYSLPLLSFEYLPVFSKPLHVIITYLETLGKYVYAFSPRETYRLETDWLEVESFVAYMEDEASHGDIYARLS